MIARTFPAGASWRRNLAAFVEHRRVQAAIIAAIIVNAIVLGLETWPAAMAAAGPVLVAIDRAVLGLFVIEISAKLIAHGPRFFRSGWNVFDFTIVAITLVPAGAGLSVLRALRILRVLRLVSIVPSMRNVVTGLFAALPGLSSIGLLLALVFYVGSVIATKLFGAAFPDWFGTMGLSAYTLFQIMTLESWSMGIVRPVMEDFPYAWLFFVTFILTTTFTVLNLFIAVIVNAMQRQHDAVVEAEAERARSERAEITHALDALRCEVAALRGEKDKTAAP